MKKIYYPFLRLPVVKLIFDRYHKAAPNREASIEARITHNGMQKYLSTGVRVLPRQWHDGMVTARIDAVQLNEFLDHFVIDIKKVLNEMVAEGRVDIFAVPDRLKELRIREVDVFEYLRKRKAVRLYGQSKYTEKRYNHLLTFLEEWGKIKRMSDLNEEIIIKLDEYLKDKGMKASSRWSNYHKVLNAFIGDAIADGYLRKNPYKYVQIDKGDDRVGLGKHLTKEEYDAIRMATMTSESLSRVRDLFVFQTNTCLSISDLRNFDEKNIVDVKGKKVYTGKRGKTQIPFTIPLLPEATKILKKYHGNLPLISDQKYNDYLKEVAKAAGVDKPVTSHWARHTGATLLLNAGVPMEVVSRVCGHASIKMTEKIYAKMYDETVVRSVNKVFKKKKK